MPKFNVGDNVIVSNKYSILSGKCGEIQSVVSSESFPGLIAYNVLIGKFQRLLHEDHLDKCVTLQQRAQDELKKLKTTNLPIILGGDENLLYLAGWHNGE